MEILKPKIRNSKKNNKRKLLKKKLNIFATKKKTKDKQNVEKNCASSTPRLCYSENLKPM